MLSILLKRNMNILPVRMLSSSSWFSKTVEVNGTNIYYETKGEGGHVFLCLPGALGSVESDFGPQFKHSWSDKLRLVGWDPPGYGKSRPPDRSFGLYFFENDAASASDLMKALGHDQYSLLGWSDGGITALLMAIMFPEQVNKLIVWGTNSFVSDHDVIIYNGIRDVNKWSEKMRSPMENMYGKEGFRRLWESWVDAMKAIYVERRGDICRHKVREIKCPTLIIHGKKDAMLGMEHPEHLKNYIHNSRVVFFDDGKHNLHMKYSKEFNSLVEEFLLS